MARSYAKTEQVLTTLKPADRDRLDAYAEANEISRAEAVRIFVLDRLDSLDAAHNERTLAAARPVEVAGGGSGFDSFAEPVIPR